MLRNKLITIVTAVSILIFLSACDFLLPGPLGRDNPADSGAQINAFGSFYAGNGSAELIWNWRPFTGTEASREIVKVRIVHKENDPPSSMYPLDRNDVQEFTAGGNAVWEKLKEYNDHYFALYRMEKSGTWLSPLYSKIHIEGEGTLDASIPGMQYLYVDMVLGTPVQSTTPPLDQYYRGFISFDPAPINDNSYGAVEDAILRFDFDPGNSVGQILIVPMFITVHDGELWEDISNPSYYDTANAVTVQISNTVVVDVQIKSVLNRCLAYKASTFALIIPSGDPGKINDPTKIFLQNFAVWRTM